MELTRSTHQLRAELGRHRAQRGAQGQPGGFERVATALDAEFDVPAPLRVIDAGQAEDLDAGETLFDLFHQRRQLRFHAAEDDHRLLGLHLRAVEVRVERVNKPPTPLQFRLLCKMSVDAINDFRPFSSCQYQPLIAEIATVDAGLVA